MSSTASTSPIQYRGSTTSGSYYFCIENLPKRFTWQDLKDLIRKEAAHGIWTEMAFFPNGQPGETGWARLQRTDEAGNLYTYLASNLVQGRKLRVHMFDTSVSPPRLIAHTCGSAPCIASARSAEASRLATKPSCWQPVSPYPANAYTGAYAVQQPAQPTPPYVASPVAVAPAPVPTQVPSAYQMQELAARMASMTTNNTDPAMLNALRARQAQIQAYAQQMAAAQQQQTRLQPQMQPQAQTQAPVQSQPQSPMYVPTPSGTYVNVSQGTIKTEVRGIFISQIDFKAGTKDIQRYFGRAGEIVKCQLQKDSQGKSKGNATVQYAAAKDAKKAVQMFNDQQFLSMRLKVRLDKDPVAVGRPDASSSRTNGSASTGRSAQQSRISTEPIIVNGSGWQK